MDPVEQLCTLAYLNIEWKIVYGTKCMHRAVSLVCRKCCLIYQPALGRTRSVLFKRKKLALRPSTITHPFNIGCFPSTTTNDPLQPVAPRESDGSWTEGRRTRPPREAARGGRRGWGMEMWRCDGANVCAAMRAEAKAG